MEKNGAKWGLVFLVPNKLSHASRFGLFARHFFWHNPLKINDLNFGRRVASDQAKSKEIPLIVYALLAGILVLVGVSMVSSLDPSGNKRR